MLSRQSPTNDRFTLFAWAVLIYNIPDFLWGAFVRASFSGDGCGANWPFCNGQVIPQGMAKPMMIEFTHRMMTSVDTFAVLALVIWAFRAFPKRDVVRRAAVWSFVFLLIEALLGAGLVLFRYVAKDQSAGRPIYLSAHLVNTMLLLATLTAVPWLASKKDERSYSLRSKSGRLWVAISASVFVSVTGAIAALGDMLFPAASLASGVRQDFAAESAMLLRLRLLHPVIAIAGAVLLIWICVSVLKSKGPQATETAAQRVLSITIFQLAVGAINMTLLAPIWMQLIHLLIADVLWIAVVLLALETMEARHAEAATRPSLTGGDSRLPRPA